MLFRSRRVGRDEELLRDTCQGAQIVGAVAELCRQTRRASRTHRIDQPLVGITSCRIEVLHRERHTPIIPANTCRRKARQNLWTTSNGEERLRSSRWDAYIITGHSTVRHHDPRRREITFASPATILPKMCTATSCGGKDAIAAPAEPPPHRAECDGR